MRYQEMQQVMAVTKRKPRKKVPKALNNVVSLRISDKEKRVLDRITAANRMNLSDVVREALDFWLTRRKGICLEP